MLAPTTMAILTNKDTNITWHDGSVTRDERQICSAKKASFSG